MKKEDYYALLKSHLDIETLRRFQDEGCVFVAYGTGKRWRKDNRVVVFFAFCRENGRIRVALEKRAQHPYTHESRFYEKRWWFRESCLRYLHRWRIDLRPRARIEDVLHLWEASRAA